MSEAGYVAVQDAASTEISAARLRVGIKVFSAAVTIDAALWVGLVCWRLVAPLSTPEVLAAHALTTAVSAITALTHAFPRLQSWGSKLKEASKKAELLASAASWIYDRSPIFALDGARPNRAVIAAIVLAFTTSIYQFTRPVALVPRTTDGENLCGNPQWKEQAFLKEGENHLQGTGQSCREQFKNGYLQFNLRGDLWPRRGAGELQFRVTTEGGRLAYLVVGKDAADIDGALKAAPNPYVLPVPEPLNETAPAATGMFVLQAPPGKVCVTVALKDDKGSELGHDHGCITID